MVMGSLIIKVIHIEKENRLKNKRNFETIASAHENKLRT